MTNQITVRYAAAYDLYTWDIREARGNHITSDALLGEGYETEDQAYAAARGYLAHGRKHVS